MKRARRYATECRLASIPGSAHTGGASEVERTWALSGGTPWAMGSPRVIGSSHIAFWHLEVQPGVPSHCSPNCG